MLLFDPAETENDLYIKGLPCLRVSGVQYCIISFVWSLGKCMREFVLVANLRFESDKSSLPRVH